MKAEEIVGAANAADFSVLHFYRRLMRGKRYGLSVLDMIARAHTPEEAYGLVIDAAKTHSHASPATRRRWKKAADARAEELR